MAKEVLSTILRRMMILGLFCYFVSRVYVAYSKLQDGKIGTLFDRITSATVKVPYWNSIIIGSKVNHVACLN